MYCIALISLRCGRKGADNYHDAPRSFRMILGRSVRNTSLFFSFTCSMRDASFAHASRAITWSSMYAWQSQIRFSSRGEEEIAEEIGARYRDGRALSGRADALKRSIRTSTHAPRARLSDPLLSSSLSPPLPPSSSLCVATRAGGKDARVTFIHPTGRSTT